MSKTTISWTNHSINPIRARHTVTRRVGHYCEKLSQGCTHCYSSRMQSRFGMPSFQEQRSDAAIEPFLDTSKFDEVLRRQKPTKYFWCDMTDMFGDWVPDEWIDQCFAVMALTPWHTHQVLTKRAKRLHDYFTTPRFLATLEEDIAAEAMQGGRVIWDGRGSDPANYRMIRGIKRDPQSLAKRRPWPGWPLPNVWVGISAENQATADERIPWLLKTPAAVRFISAEPLLEPITIAPYLSGLDWCIAGGESGPKARPCNVAWLGSLKDQCAAADVAYWLKQMGSYSVRIDDCDSVHGPVSKRIHWQDRKGSEPDEWPMSYRTQQFPTPPAATAALTW